MIQTGPSISTRRMIAVAILLLATIAANRSTALAQSTEPKRRVIPMTINKGQNITINGIAQDEGAPAEKVVDNPNALVVQDAPGRIELIGADTGSWKINATLATGEKVTYAVTVTSNTPPQGDLNPGTAPPTIP